MLFDIIEKNININLKKGKREINTEKFPFDLHGELEIIGSKNGKVFHYEKKDNTITKFAKHATMHLMTGAIFSTYGTSRLTGDSDHVGSGGDTFQNKDGTLISGKQYFDDSAFPGADGWWSRPIAGDSLTHLYPFFPVKMLFGTGKEWKSWADIGDSSYYAQYIDDGWSETLFDNASINDASNDYSNDFSGDTLRKNRSINDIYSEILTTPIITENDYAVTGAVKDGLYNNEAGDSTKIELVGGNYFSKKEYSGVGNPAFIYARRTSRWYQSGSEISLSWDESVENKITYTVTMPEQTGVNAGKFYPYNGYVLKEAGLFSDARFVLKNTSPANDSESDDTNLNEFDYYTKMPHGILYAKRYISPITKSHDVSITARWSIYL